MKKLFFLLLFFSSFQAMAQPTKKVLITGDSTFFFSYGPKGNTVEFGNSDTSRAGVRLPRVAHPDSIKTPKRGMIVYCTVDSALYVRQNFGWQKVGSGGSTTVDSSIYATRARLSNELNLKQDIITVSNGIYKIGNAIKLGGDLTQSTTIGLAGNNFNIGQNYFNPSNNLFFLQGGTNTNLSYHTENLYQITGQRNVDRTAGSGYANANFELNNAAKSFTLGSYTPFSLSTPAPTFSDSLSTQISGSPGLLNITTRQTQINGLYANINAFLNLRVDSNLVTTPSYRRVSGMQWYNSARRTPAYWGGNRIENVNHILYVDNYEFASDYSRIQTAINNADNGDIVLLGDTTYTIDQGLVIGKSITLRGGSNTVIKRVDQDGYTIVGSAGRYDTAFRLNNTAGLQVGQSIAIALDTTFKRTTAPYTIERLTEDSVYISDSIGTTIDGDITYPNGSNVYKSITLITVAEIDVAQPAVSVNIENIIFDGNRANNRGTYLWNHNMGVISSSKGTTKLRNCTFINSPTESLLGHNLDVNGCRFYNLNGSGVHLTFDKSANLEREFISNITNNIFDSTNKVSSADINGHSEGVITTSNSGGYVTVMGNRITNVLNDAVYGALYASSSDADYGTNQVLVTNNIIENASKLVYLVDTLNGTIKNVQIKSNYLRNIGVVDYNEWLPRTQPYVVIDQYNNGVDSVWKGTGDSLFQRINSIKKFIAVISGGSGWSITGNSGTTAGTNFIGTTDDVDLVFKRNGLLSGRIGSENTYFGNGAGSSRTTGVSNAFLGQGSGYFNTTGSSNTFIGDQSGASNTTGSNNIYIGNQSGAFSTTLSNRLIINSITHGSVAADTIESLIYGIQSATIANQKLRVNGFLQVNDGTQGSGKVFTSDANGVGSWQTPSGGGGGYVLDTTTNNTGLVTDYQRDTATAARLASIALKANDNAVVKLTTDQSISGIKTFSNIRLNNIYSTIDLLGGYGNNHFGFLNAFAPKVNLEGGNASYFAINNSALGVVATIDKSGAANFGGSSSLPVASAALQVTSTTKGFLPPRMTTTNQDAISSPATGLVIYNTTLNCLTQYDGTLWTSLISAIKGTGTIDFASIAAGGNNQNDVTITGAALGDMVYIEQDKAEPNVTYSAWVETTNTIRVKAHNISASSIDPASKSFKIIVYKN